MECVGISIWLSLFGPIALEKGTTETHVKRFELPVTMSREQLTKCNHLRLWVSTDRGKTWKHHQEIKAIAEKSSVKVVPPPDEEWALLRFTFAAPCDGLYWFAVQTVFKDGTLEPRNVNAPVLKVLVNTLNRKVVRKSAGVQKTTVVEIRP